MKIVQVMELLPGGDLRHRLRKAKEPLEEKVARQIVRDICCGMAFLHAKQTVHGDLKSANVLFDAAGTAKVCVRVLVGVGAVHWFARKKTCVFGAYFGVCGDALCSRARR